jgi:hypothetical protein
MPDTVDTRGVGEEAPSPKALNPGEADVKPAGSESGPGPAPGPEAAPAAKALSPEEIAARLASAERIERENAHLKSRIGKLTGQRKQLEETLAAKTGPTPQATETPEFRRAVDEAAAARSAKLQFDADCLAAVQRGKALYEDFQPKITQLWEDCGKEEPVKYSALVAATLETGASEKILYELAQDPSEAARLMDLSPVRQGIELAKLASRLNEAKPLSSAPKPIPALRGVQHEAIDPRDPDRASKLATRTWMERRQQQVDEAWEKERPRRRG